MSEHYPTQAEYEEQLNEIFAGDPELYNYIVHGEYDEIEEQAMETENETIIFVVFDNDGHPHQVITQRPGTGQHIWYSDYDFAHSKRYGLLYRYAGDISLRDGIAVYDHVAYDEHKEFVLVDTRYWAAPSITVIESARSKRLETLLEPYTFEKLFDSREVINCEDGILWCSECEDFLPDDIPDYCEHIWYCLVCEATSTPDERCEHAEEE